MKQISEEVGKFSKEYGTIMCTAGGFDVSNIADEEILSKYIAMDQMNLHSAIMTGHLATKFLGPQAMLMFTGAAAVFDGPVNFAYGYSLSKIATHQLALTMSTREEIPETSSVVTILPGVIDTPANRAVMEHQKDWQPPEKIAQLTEQWASG